MEAERISTTRPEGPSEGLNQELSDCEDHVLNCHVVPPSSMVPWVGLAKRQSVQRKTNATCFHLHVGSREQNNRQTKEKQTDSYPRGGDLGDWVKR